MECVCACLCVCAKIADRQSVVAVHFFSRGGCPFSIPSLEEVGNQRPKESTIRSFGLARVSLCSLLWRIKGVLLGLSVSIFQRLHTITTHTAVAYHVEKSRSQWQHTCFGLAGQGRLRSRRCLKTRRGGKQLIAVVRDLVADRGCDESFTSVALPMW